jgi:hypothetical protein
LLASAPVDAADAIAELLELSSHVEAAVVFDPAGVVEGSSFSNEDRATALARRALDVLAAAGGIRRQGARVTRVEARFDEGSLIVVSEDERLAAATTVPDPPVALVAYDLRNALRSSAAAPAKPRRPRKPKAPADA